MGFPLDGISARVSDETGKELKDGEIGTLEIKGPNVFKGYWKLPEKTKEEFREDGFSSPVIWHAVTSRATFPSSAGAKT